MHLSTTGLATTLLCAQVAHTQGIDVSTTAAKQHLVILGASYAGHWDAPELSQFEVTNRGVGGEQTHQMLARFESDVLAVSPDVVLIWGHINNVHNSPSDDYPAMIERIKGDYRSMVARAREGNIDVILATEVTLTEAMGWVDRLAAFVGHLRGKQGYAARINEQVRAVNTWLRSYASEQGILLLDFEAVFDDGSGFRKREYTSEDGSHISAAGYRDLTTYAREALDAEAR